MMLEEQIKQDQITIIYVANIAIKYLHVFIVLCEKAGCLTNCGRLLLSFRNNKQEKYRRLIAMPCHDSTQSGFQLLNIQSFNVNGYNKLYM